MNSFLLFFFCMIAEEPWGIDQELVAKKEYTSHAGIETIIQFHNQVISLADGPRSHFFPSSSAYMLQAVRKHGFGTGVMLGCDRLLRENSDRGSYPLYRTRDGHFLKYDPVP